MLLNNKNRLCIFLICFCVAPLSHAKIYKWVDKHGVTHYSQQKPVAQKAEKLKLRPQPSSVKTAEEIHQEKEAKRRLQIDQENAALKKAPAKKKQGPPKSVTGGISDGSDAGNCALARDVLSGSLRHTNGEAVDAYDIKVAKRDIEKFCQ